ncbi:9347_t:CDS:10 [Ambispora gerdemannii]|uniref:9347_t:CDS:1 n=1 Tax=Ambispora gerdemannii TaxID=144530 RepID=A0A9N8VVE9_9GLOM|nr:9347_t:CDS:10 [Ambispora gerdemannii]
MNELFERARDRYYHLADQGNIEEVTRSALVLRKGMEESTSKMSVKTQILAPNLPCPELSVRWFHAVDVPRSDPTKVTPSASFASNTGGTKDAPVPVAVIKQPSAWVPFSRRDSAALEQAYQSKASEQAEQTHQSEEPRITVPVNEDYLFEVDINDRAIYPVYWPGPVYEVRRGTWFYQGDGNFFLPCDENLSSQVEAGYLKHQPWIIQEEETSKEVDSPTETKKKQPTEKSCRLYGRYLSQYVVYTGPTCAWLLSDDMTGKLAKTFYAKVTMGVNLGGTRLLRGYQEVEIFESKSLGEPERKKREDPEKERENDLTKDKQLEVDPETVQTEDYDNEESEEDERTIDHLILVIHGVGQKLSERMESVNFVHDVNILRRTIKTMYITNPPVELTRTDSTLPQRRNSVPAEKLAHIQNGIQVLPVQWRQEIKFGMASGDQDTQTDLGLQENEEGQTTLDEITLDGVPTIRMLISDVLVDVLLYMTPRYREQMINTVTRECNRVYGLFIERNPRFLEIGGRVSIYGHSLGSVLAFDILCHQPPLVPSTVSGIFDERNSNNPEMQQFHERLVKLDFPVANFFALGSPIGLFLMLKGLKIGSRSNQLQHKLKEMISGDHSDSSPDEIPELKSSSSIPLCYPAVRNIYNIFHRADPIAYRIEPLIARHYGVSLKPALIPYHKGGLKAVHIGIQEFEKEDPTSAAKLRSLNFTGREGILDVSYLNAITVHLSYWSDSDAAFFILRECYRGIEDDEEKSLRERAFSLLELRDKPLASNIQSPSN